MAAAKSQGFIERDLTSRIRSYLPPMNFITLHYLYFISVCLVASAVFWGSSEPKKSIAYTDCLFLVVSAMTEAGLNTVNLSTMTTFQQFILWFLIIIGSAIWVSIFTVHTRKRVFETRFKYMIKSQRDAKRLRRRSLSETREVPVQKRLATSQKDAKPLDKSVFESRHSEPRDPIQISLRDEVTAGSSRHGEKEAGVEDGTLLSEQTASISIINRAESGPNSSTSKLPGTNAIARKGFKQQGCSPNLGIEDRSAVVDEDSVIDSRDNHGLTFAPSIGHKPNTSVYTLPGTMVMARTESIPETVVEKESSSWKYTSYLTRYNTGRNAQFYGLSYKEREHLGGVEYRAISLLAWIVPVYFTLWQLISCLSLGAYMAYKKPNVSLSNGINPWWLGAFNAVSAFNNSGMSLLDLNMIPFQRDSYPLLTMGLLILAGNTAYPIFLRLIIWTMLKLLCFFYPDEARHEDHKETLRFVLQYPRRVYTNLFPSGATWWLLFVIVVLNGIDWAAFELLNIGNQAVQAIPAHFRVLDGLFQAIAVRSGGFYVISIPALRIGLQVLYVIMMYISVYPVVITMRNSNVYEERSLGIYADDPQAFAFPERQFNQEKEVVKSTVPSFLKRTLTSVVKTSGPGGKSPSGTEFVRQQVRGQLSHDLWTIVVAILFISCIEVTNFDRDPSTYSVFNIVFEVVSGYGCVGISVGLPDQAYSFSGSWHKASKLILCAVMLRGRHRGLPVALDRAVRLPSENEDTAEKERKRMSAHIKRRLSMLV
ncbi:hypothetical protein BP5796_06736 [Coleophoma crateriformis]|uniref:Potassium transport protein n=1 Tax=Coleophoma crateriformis TaxID=565419 RepID=A0A3D8RPH8_9HELO|nr:hypothetical protein BP5796_06736 [Coleophoma crateriformis]